MAGYDFEFYETGKISVTAGQKAFTGSGTAWKLRGCEGALVVVVGAGTVNFVSSLSTDAAGEFRTAWAGPTLANASYVMWLPSAVAATALANHQRLAEIIASIQTAQPASEILAGLAALQPANNRLIYATGPKTFDLTPLSPFARSLLDDGDAATFYATLGEIPNERLPARLRSSSPNIGDANTANENGFFSSDGASTNVPSSSPAVILNIRYSATGGYQRWVSVTGDEVQERRQSGGNWSAWKRVDIAATRSASSATITLPTSAGNLIIQVGTTTASTDGGGYGDFALAMSYPTAQITCLMNTGNYSASSAVIGPRTGATDLTTSRVFFRSGTPSALIRINYLSIGY